MSPISSRNSVPPLGLAQPPETALPRAPVKAPGAYPNNSASIRFSGMRRAVDRHEWAIAARTAVSCVARAKSSLPTPDSPWIRIGIGLPTTRRALSVALRHCAHRPVSRPASASLSAASHNLVHRRGNRQCTRHIPMHLHKQRRAVMQTYLRLVCPGRRLWRDSSSSKATSITLAKSVCRTQVGCAPAAVRAERLQRLAPTIQPSVRQEPRYLQPPCRCLRVELCRCRRT
jgi:hypothetical protein